jgi:hypothetical protein
VINLPRINVVVPFSRPRNKAMVLQNFGRQVYPNKRLIVVENGAGIGTFGAHEAAVLRTSPAGQSVAKNTAIDFLRKTGERFMSVFDDDDHYMPSYLAEQVPHLEKFPLVGKNQHLVMQKDGFFLLNPYSHSGTYDWCSGGVQTFDVKESGYYPIQQTGEDVQFCHDMIARGRLLYVTSPWNYVYERRNADHTFGEDVVKRARTWRLVVVPIGPELDFDVAMGRRRVG